MTTGERENAGRMKVGLVCSHGGHLTEMLQLEEAFRDCDTFYLCYDAATTRVLPNAYRVPNRSRNPLEYLRNIVRFYRILRRERPGLIVSTGAEIAIPAVLAAKLLRIPTLYIECGAQAATPSLTGRIMCRLADQFFVQWRELVGVYGPRARFRGSLIDEDDPFGGDRSAERRMTATLVQPAHTGGFSSDQPPMGLAYLASVLQRHGCETRIIDANVERLTPDEVTRLLLAQGPALVGVTVTTPLVPGALALTRELRRRGGDAPALVAGGPHATVAPEELLVEGGFDFVVRGEGEETLGELVECLMREGDPGAVAGLSWRRDGRVVHNPARALCEDVRALPYPDWSLFPLRRYSSLARRHDFSLPIATSRGCPYACTFCYKGVYGQRLRMREPDDVVDEWQFLIERYGAKEIAVLDDNFTMWEDRAIAICRLLVERGLHRVPWSTTNGIRVNHASAPVLEAMKEAGCYRVYFGIESGVPRILESLDKRITLEQARTAVATAKQAGLEVGAYFMLGNVGETAADMDATIDFAMSLDLDLAQFTIATPYPGTVMYEQVKQGGTMLIDSWEELASYGRLVFTMGELTPELVSEKYRRALRRFYFRPRFIARQLGASMSWSGFRRRARAAMVLGRMVFGGERRRGGATP